MDGAFPGDLMVGGFLLDVFGTGYTRVLLVHLTPTASVSWDIKIFCGLQMRTEGSKARLADPIPLPGRKEGKKRASVVLEKTSSKAAEVHSLS